VFTGFFDFIIFLFVEKLVLIKYVLYICQQVTIKKSNKMKIINELPERIIESYSITVKEDCIIILGYIKDLFLQIDNPTQLVETKESVTIESEKVSVCLFKRINNVHVTIH